MNTQIDTEIWKPVVGYEGRYEVSNLGRVRSLRLRLKKRDSPFILKASKIYYHEVCLCGPNKRVHCLVLEAFVGPRPKGFHGAHLDGNVDNNNLGNLAWVTPKENTSHKVLHGTSEIGERNGRAKFTAAIIRAILKRNRSGENYSELSRFYGCSDEQIRRICRRENWKHVAGVV